MIVFFSRLALSASSFASVIICGWLIDFVFHAGLPWFVELPVFGFLFSAWFISFWFMVMFWFVEPKGKHK